MKKKRPEGILLISSNPKYEPMFYTNEDIENLPHTHPRPRRGAAREILIRYREIVMKSKTDRFIVLLLTIFMTLLFASPVSAHPGRTDANGGHYNRSSGEYHYHHGYSAHQHIDGKCPYDFDDKTAHNSGGGKSSGNGNSSSNGIGNSVGNKSTAVTASKATTVSSKTEEPLTVGDIISAIFAILIILIYCSPIWCSLLAFLCPILSDAIKKVIYKFKNNGNKLK